MGKIVGLTAAVWIALATAAFAQSPALDPLFDEPGLLSEGMLWVEQYGQDDGGQPRDGLFPEFGGMITGSGWIAIGPGYRRTLFGGRAIAEASAALSWRAYKVAQARLELPHLAGDRLTIGSKVLWHDYTQVRYFGAGSEAPRTGISDYRIEATNVVGYAVWRPRPVLSISANIGWLSRPALASSVGTFDRNDPNTLDVHALDPAASLPQQPRFVHGEIGVMADTRDHPSYPTRGSVVRAAWSTYHDRPTDGLSFNRYEAEAAYFLPLLRRGVLAVRAWGVFSHPLDGHVVPFYLLPSLGGHNTLRGYADYRFHDRHMLVANVETRWALLRHVDAAAFFDAGNVASRAGDLNFDRTSAGFGLRLHTRTTTIARFDIAHSVEGWRFMLKLSDPFRMGHATKRTAALPFVP